MSDQILDLLGYASCAMVMGAVGVSLVVNIWCLMVLSLLLLDGGIGAKILPENPDRHSKRRKRIKLVK